MKNCPLCAHEYYDEARRCPDCEYDFPADGPAAPPEESDVASALGKIARGEDPGTGPAASLAERIDALFRDADDDPNELWRRSPQRLRHVSEYEMALRLRDAWKKSQASKPREGR
ncbi:MAG: hypothetical protein HYY17_04270 [Planctomycetes bacterium]|nr:hypothetical protein [Planctomycetota bacterium]